MDYEPVPHGDDEPGLPFGPSALYAGPRLKWLALLGATVLSGVLFATALPPIGFAPLGPLALVPLMMAVRRRGFAIGFAAGMATCLLTAKLLDSPLFFKPTLVEESSGWTYLGFCLFGLVVSLSAGLRGASERPIAFFVTWAVTFEAMLLVELPAHMAITQYRSAWALSLASFGGIWAVSAVLWGATFWLADRLSARDWRALTLLIPIAGTALGRTPEAGTLDVAAVQTRSMDRPYLAAQAHSPAVIAVWPELSGTTSTPDQLAELAAQSGVVPFVTSFPDRHRPKAHNAAAIFSKEGMSDLYFKRKPFASESQIHEAGTRAVVVPLGAHRFGLNICFDSCYPGIMRDTARLEPDVLLLPSLDPPVPNAEVSAIHAAYTPFRAAETGVAIVRSDIVGFSMIVDRYGAIVAEAGAGTEETIAGRVVPGRRPTVAMIFGDGVAVLAAAIALLSLFRTAKRNSPTFTNE